MSRLFVTGFGAFGKFDANPSQTLAEGCGLPHRILEVSTHAVDEWLESGELDDYDKVLMIGVNGKGERPHLELSARNHYGKNPDVRGIAAQGPILPYGPPQLAATLWPECCLHEEDEWALSTDAGDYLCNYIFYSMLHRYPQKQAGFLHIPPADRVPLEQQAQTLARLVALL